MFFLLIACIIYFQSPLSHVNKIHVVGNQTYTDQQLASMSGLSKETNIWNIDKKGIESTIENLEEVKSASVEVDLPNDVVIQVEEWKRMAFIKKNGYFWPILENGFILDEKVENNTLNAPILIGFSEDEILKDVILALSEIPVEVFNSISEIHYTPKNADKLHINLFMNDGFEVSATLRSFADKMTHYPSIVSQLDPNVKGVIDMEVGSYFRTYDLEGAEEENEEKEG